MSIRLLYIGAVAGLVPAASLRALAGDGAVFVPKGLPADLADVVAEASGAPPEGELEPDDLPALWARFEGEPVTVCIAGERGPALARALRARATARGVALETVPDGPDFDDCLIGQELVSLRRITSILREQCPWDREQRAADIISYTIEEVYELADAVMAERLDAEHDELGDVLFQVYFLSRLLEEQRAGDLGSVAAEIEQKLIRRHAHIFGDAVAETAGDVRGVWERVKRGAEGREGVFHNVPPTLPALLLARKVQQRAAAVGFDWDHVLEAFPKIAEEHGELAELLEGGGPARVDEWAAQADAKDPSRDSSGSGSTQRPDGGVGRPADETARWADAALEHERALRHEFGDLLFATVNVARKAGIDPEIALRQASDRFVRRVDAAVELAARDGRDWSALDLGAQDDYYRRAKSGEGGLYSDHTDVQEGSS